MHHAEPYFGSPCRARTRSSRILLARLTWLESRTKTPYQMLLINWLTKVTNDPIVQGASPINVIGVASHEDCRNGVPDFDEVSVEFDSGHRGHMDVGENLEIITYVREGAVTDKDSLGNEGRTEAGDVQVMSAGAGIRHAKYNLADARCGLRAFLPAGTVNRCDGQALGVVRRWRLSFLVEGRRIGG